MEIRPTEGIYANPRSETRPGMKSSRATSGRLTEQELDALFDTETLEEADEDTR